MEKRSLFVPNRGHQLPLKDLHPLVPKLFALGLVLANSQGFPLSLLPFSWSGRSLPSTQMPSGPLRIHGGFWFIFVLVCVVSPVGSDECEGVVLSVFIRSSDFHSAIHFNTTVQREQKECNRISNKIFDHLIDELKMLGGRALGECFRFSGNFRSALLLDPYFQPSCTKVFPNVY